MFRHRVSNASEVSTYAEIGGNLRCSNFTVRLAERKALQNNTEVHNLLMQTGATTRVWNSEAIAEMGSGSMENVVSKGYLRKKSAFLRVFERLYLGNHLELNQACGFCSK